MRGGGYDNELFLTQIKQIDDFVIDFCPAYSERFDKEYVTTLEPTASTSNWSKPFTKKKKPIAKDVEEVKSKLLNSLKETRFRDYSSYSPNMSNQASCLKSLKELDKAIAESTKRTIYFSVFQGEVINKLQQFTGEKMPKVKNRFTLAYSISHCTFLIKLWTLTQKYNKIMYSNLPPFF